MSMNHHTDRPYVGIDRNGTPLHVGDLVVLDHRVWITGTDRITDLAGDTQRLLIHVGTINLERA